MLKKITFPASLIALAILLWLGSDLMELALGVALFIFGMLLLEDGFKAFAGGALESILQSSTDRLWKSLTLGFTSTTLMQSSTLVTLIAISFVSSEMISLAAGLGIILGANIGTSTGAWLIAGLGLKVDIASYAMPVLVFGVFFLMQKSKPVKGIGYLFLGIGFLFFGIHYMKEGFVHLQGSFDLSDYSLTGIYGLLVFALLGTLITFVMQSSHATLLIVIAALAAGQVSYENSLGLAIGASLGSAITTALGGLAASIGGKRLAAAQVLFSCCTTVLALVFINPLTWLTDWLASYLYIQPDDYLLKLALFQTLFRTLGAVIFMPFLHSIEAILLRYIVIKQVDSEQPLYLHQEILEVPASVVAAVRKEVEHLFFNAYELFIQGLSLRAQDLANPQRLSLAVQNTKRIQPVDVEGIYEDKIKSLHSAIVAFIAEAQENESTAAATEELYALRKASQDIVSAVKSLKHLHNNLSRYALSSNSAVRKNYDQIRFYLAGLLASLHKLLTEEDYINSLEELEKLYINIKEVGLLMASELDESIRFRRLSPQVATSIMNDENYFLSLAHNLIAACKTLLSKDGVPFLEGALTQQTSEN